MQIRTEAACIAEEKPVGLVLMVGAFLGRENTGSSRVGKNLKHKIVTTCMEAFKYLSNM